MTGLRKHLAASAAISGAMILSVLMGVQPAAAQAPSVCAPQDKLSAKLGSQYGEAVSAEGVDGNGNLVQVYSSPDTGSWTIAVTLPGGPSCIVSSGEGWSDRQLADFPKPARRPDLAS
ncbi:hypothetical protein [Thalassobaculum sp.]|uniref:hypothetical protein n=1 Tax=Thalassobaculum sp. TaxID=2022740 RepID=UPI0032EDC2B1